MLRAALPIFCVFVLLSGRQMVEASEPATPAQIVVQLHGGQELAGYVDARTDGEALVMRFEGMASRLWRTIPWSRVAGARIGSESLAADALQQQAATLASTAQPIDRTRVGRDTAGDTGNAEQVPAVPAGGEASHAVRAMKAIQGPPEVKSVAIEAQLGQWDADVEPDGLLIVVAPQDAWGLTVPASGTLTVELIARRSTAARSEFTFPRGEPLPTIGRWTKRVEPYHIGPQGAVYRLPFQAVHPSFEHDLASIALVHARLAVPGSGVLETSAPMVRIRRFSPTRDQQQVLRGTRFLPTERLGRTQ